MRFAHHHQVSLTLDRAGPVAAASAAAGTWRRSAFPRVLNQPAPCYGRPYRALGPDTGDSFLPQVLQALRNWSCLVRQQRSAGRPCCRGHRTACCQLADCTIPAWSMTPGRPALVRFYLEHVMAIATTRPTRRAPH